MPRRTTLKDVAAQAGVSASTVCRALGSSPKIPNSTRARIRKIATSLGYRPDPPALRARQTAPRRLHRFRHPNHRPGSIDYATLNWTPTQPHIAGIDQRPAAIGSGAIDLVIAQLNRGERGVPLLPATTLIEGTWVNGPSVRKKKTPQGAPAE